MEHLTAGLFGALGAMTFFAFLAFCVWIEYRKKKDERDAAHHERMKALEMGFPPLDAEIERAKAYASAAWAAGLIGLLVPLVLTSLTVAGTIVALLNRRTGENITAPLIVAWSIVAVLALVVVVRSLGVIRQLPRPTGDALPRPPSLDKRGSVLSTDIQGKRLEL